MRGVRIAAMTALMVLGLAALAWASGAAHEAAAAHGAGQGVSHEKMMDFIYRIMNFAVLATVLVILLRKPLKSAFKGRTEGIAEELAELEAKREEARREFAEMEKRVADAQGEREKILAEFRAQGEREREKILDEARSTAERIKGQAQFTIDQETKDAKDELRREVAELSSALAEDLLKQKITADDQTRLVDEYLTKVGQEAQ